MKKCTLCIDRIYNENLAEDERVPACVATCPVGARHFGDLGDPNFAVSQLVAERGGYDLMPEMGYKPVNKYLPPPAAPGPAGLHRRGRKAARPSRGRQHRQQAPALARPRAVAVTCFPMMSAIRKCTHRSSLPRAGGGLGWGDRPSSTQSSH